MPHYTDKPLTNQLVGIRRRLRSMHLMRCTGWLLCGTATAVLAMRLWMGVAPLREGMAALLFGGALLFAVLAIIGIIIRTASSWHDLSQLALEVEKKHPELLDSFICAVQLEETQRPLTSLEKILLEKQQREALAAPKRLWEVFRHRLAWKYALPPVVLGAFLWLAAVRTEAWSNIRMGLADGFGECSGLAIEWQSDVPAGTDTSINVQVLRGSQQADIEVEEQGSSAFTTPLTRQKTGFAFTHYGVRNDFRFRVSTPSLRSHWHTVQVYDPPFCEEEQMELRAQPYTHRPSVKSDKIQDWELVSGDTLHIQIRTQSAVTAAIRPPKDGEALPLTGERVLSLTFQPEQTGCHELVLTDKDGHQAKFPFALTIQPDLPPVLAISEPTPDAVLKPGEFLRIQANASDDFGLTACRLHFSVNGEETRQVELQVGDGSERLWELAHQLETSANGLQEGDSLVAWLSVTDNRVPHAQTARSGLMLVSVRPDTSQASQGEGQQQASKQQELNIADLLTEARRLLRLTWDTLTMADSELRTRTTGELTGALYELEVQIRKRFTELQKAAGSPIQPPVPELFAKAAHEFASAARLAEKNLQEESLFPQQRGLAALVALDSELRKNAAQATSSGGEGGEGQGKEEGQEQQNQNGQDGKENNNTTQERQIMKQALAQLRELQQKQGELNSAMARQDTIAKPLAEKQESIREQTEGIRQQLGNLKSTSAIAEGLKAATAEMSGAAQALQQEDKRLGGIHGQRAQMNLAAAIQTLEDAVRQATANAIAQLARQADQLAQQQRKEAQNSEKLVQNHAKDEAARDRQTAVEQKTRQLLDNASQSAAELQEEFPEAAKALSQAISQSRAKGLERAQTRARNALLYQRYDRAAKEQTDAANYLQELAGQLGEAASSLPSLTAQELRELLQELSRQAAQIDAAMKDASQSRSQQRMEEGRRQATRTVQDAAQATKNRELQALANEMSLDGDVAAGEMGHLSLQQISRAYSVLEAMLGEQLRAAQQRLNRRLAPPPERYRRQIQEYFRDIGRE